MLWLSMGTPCAASKRCDTTPICRYSLLGLITTLLALMSAAWILMTLEVAVVATIGISWAIYVICRQARRIHDKFKLTKADTVSFDDILNSGVIPGASGRRLSTAEDDDDDEVHALIAKGGARGRGTYDV